MTKAQAPLSLPILLLLVSIAPMLVAFASQYFGGWALHPPIFSVWHGGPLVGLTAGLPPWLQLWGPC
jgi:hypothetical protein